MIHFSTQVQREKWGKIRYKWVFWPVISQYLSILAEKVKKFEGAGIHESYSKRTTHHWFGSRTIIRWFQNFRDNRERFVNTPFHTSQIYKYPSIFHINPSLKEKFILYAKTNINGLKAEVLYDYFHHTIVPELIEEKKEVTGETMSKE